MQTVLRNGTFPALSASKLHQPLQATMDGELVSPEDLRKERILDI